MGRDYLRDAELCDDVLVDMINEVHYETISILLCRRVVFFLCMHLTSGFLSN